MNKEDLVKKAEGLGIKNADKLTVDDLKAIVKLSTDLTASNEANVELSTKLSNTEAAAGAGAPVVTVGKKSYLMPLEKATLSGAVKKAVGKAEVTRELVAKDADVAKALIKAGSGFLVEVAEKED